MKKKSGSRIGRVFSRIINIREWFDWDRLKSFTAYLVNGFKRLFVPRKNTEVQSFDAAQKEFKLTNKDLLIKQNALFRLSMVMITAAVLIFIYSIYHFYFGHIRAGIISLVVMLIALALAFRYHFWYFQIKNRKLGCTFDEWYRQGFLGRKNE